VIKKIQKKEIPSRLNIKEGIILDRWFSGIRIYQTPNKKNTKLENPIPIEKILDEYKLFIL
jgi:hypothetical protein